MSPLAHFLVLYRSHPQALALPRDEVRERLHRRCPGPWQLLESGPFLIAWLGEAANANAPFLLTLGDPYNVATARPGAIATGELVTAGELDGVFAAFAFDPATTQGTLLTDRFGLFPLYVHDDQGSLCYCTSLSLLLAVRRPACRIDPLSVHEMLTLHMVLGERTFFREIGLVAPAAAVHLRSGPPRSAVYWTWDANTQRAPAGLDLVHETRALLQQAVLRGVPADVRMVGLRLDGGLDSRLLGAILASNGVPVQAYTTEIGRELAITRQVAQSLQIPLRLLTDYDQQSDVSLAHQAGDCSYSIDSVLAGQIGLQAARDGCDVLFDALGVEPLLDLVGTAPNPDELANRLERAFLLVDEDLLHQAAVEDSWMNIVPMVRTSLQSLAKQAFDNAGPHAATWFLMTNRLRKYTFGSCLANMQHLPGRFPYVTTRLFEHELRLPLELRQNHTLQRQIQQTLFPEPGEIAAGKRSARRPARKGTVTGSVLVWVEAALRRLSRGRVSLLERGSFDVTFRTRIALQQMFRAVLDNPAPELAGILPPDLAAKVVKQHLAGRNLGTLLQGLYTVKHFLMRFLAPEMASLRDPGP